MAIKVISFYTVPTHSLPENRTLANQATLPLKESQQRIYDYIISWLSSLGILYIDVRNIDFPDEINSFRVTFTHPSGRIYQAIKKETSEDEKSLIYTYIAALKLICSSNRDSRS